MYHGWEKYQVGASGAWQSATTIRINPTELIGKYGQMAFRLNYWGPTGNQKDTRVQIELVAHEADNSGEHWQQDPCIP
jgi:complex iron-sulfur molybdoenzyme family reductase subunit alpha